jgi:hypothetical protein
LETGRFRDQYSGSLQSEETMVWKRLGEAIRGIFMEFTNLIRQISSEEVNLEGELHPITSYAMNYLCAASRSRRTLEQVFGGDYGDSLKEYPKNEDRVHSSSYLPVQMGFIMELLESKLIAESKFDAVFNKRTDLPLHFLIRNSDYIVQKAKECELGTILGDDWFKKQPTQFGRFRLLLIEYQNWNLNREQQKVELSQQILLSFVLKEVEMTKRITRFKRASPDGLQVLSHRTKKAHIYI